MKKIFNRWFIFIAVVGLAACSRPDAPVFRGVHEVKVKEKIDDHLILTAYADFYNPNDYKITLKEADIEILLNDRKITHFRQKYNLKIEKNSNFTVPLEASFSQNEISKNVFSSALTILMGKKLKVKYLGNIKVKTYGIKIKVPVNGESEINPKSF